MGPRTAPLARGVGLALLALLLAGAAPAGPVGAQAACVATKPDAEGPFYEAGAPLRPATGHGLLVAGLVKSAAGCTPLAGARLEWWSANRDGRYDRGHRASQLADDAGRYRYETDPPGRYPGRPPHLHVRVTAPGHRTLVTQLYPKSGEVVLEMDFVLTRD